MFMMLIQTETVTWHYQCGLDKDISNYILVLIWNDGRENDIFALFGYFKHAPYQSGFNQS